MLSKGPSSSLPHETEHVLILGADGKWQVTDGFALFIAEFGRDGHDLLVQDTYNNVLRLPGYFIGDNPAEVISDDGASLSGRVVERLAGPLFSGQYAQAGGAEQADAIGQVETVGGGAFAQRTDGTIVQLEIGTKVFQGDVVRTDTDGSLGLTFTDGTIFTLASGSRMVLDELIYDPQSTENSGVFDLVQGGFVFIAGQAAGTGGIEINTPAATMGIRGTTVKINIQTANGVSTVTVSLNPDPDGGIGSIDLFDLSGNLISTITSTDTKWIIRPPFTNDPPIEVERFEADLNDDAALLSQAVAAFQSAVGRVASGEMFVELAEGDNDAPEDGTDTNEGGQEEGDSNGNPVPPPPLDETGEGSSGSESGSGNPELDGIDEPLPDSDEAPTDEDEATLDAGNGFTDVASNGNAASGFEVPAIRSVEDTPVTGQLPIIDGDGNPFEVTLVRGAENGLVVLARDGVFTYTPNENFEGTDSFIVTAEDSEGGVTESEITVVVDAVNDAPVVDFRIAEGTALETSVSAADDSGRATGRVTYRDVDEGETPGTWSIAASAENTTTFGVISIDAQTGVWAYDLDQVAADALAQDQNIVETFFANVTDGGGAVDTTIVVVTVTGSNDGPIVTSDAAEAALSEGITGFNTLGVTPTPSAIEAAGGTGATAGSVTGEMSFFDVDQGGLLGQWSVAAAAGNATAFGAVAIDAITGVWVYTLDERAADVLGNGDTATETYTATVTDTFGATASQQIMITIAGFNDAPTIEFSIADIEATVLEEGFVAPSSSGNFQSFRVAAIDVPDADATGTLRYVDPDSQPGDSATWAVAPDGPSLGSMTIDAATGQWHYFLDEAAAESLDDGQQVIETFTATVTDSLGAASGQTITITVVGSRDTPTVVGLAGDLSGAAAEGGISTASGTLTYLDPDADLGEVSTWSVAPNGTSRGSMTIDPVTGEWLYTLDQSLADSLGQGAQVDELFTATLTDAAGATLDQTITIALTGENDAPVITKAQTSGSVEEAGDIGAGTPSATGILGVSDPDSDGAILIWTVTPDGAITTALGAMTINPVSGTWTYTLDEAAAQSMTTGDTVVERFAASVSDPFEGTDTRVIEVTINGTNDAPVVVNGTGNVVVADALATIDLSVLATDVDAGEDGSTLIYALTGNPSQGSAQIIGTDLIFTLGNDFDDLVLDETAEVVLNFTASDAEGARAAGSVTVTITGTNGAPSLDAGAISIGEDAAQITFDLATLGSDPDVGENGSTLTYAISGAPAAGLAVVSGTTLTFSTNAEFEDLEQDEIRTVSIEITATDRAGETATSTVEVTINGTDDPSAIGGVITGLVTEDAAASLTTGGLLTVTDPDAGGAFFVAQTATAGSYGSFTLSTGGAWNYAADNAQAAVQGLNSGDTLTESFTAVTVDGTSQRISIDISGANDAPVATAATATIEVPLDVSGSEWTAYGGHHYQFVEANLTWTDARAAANSIGGYLPNVTSTAENDFLQELTANPTGWLGGSDAAIEGDWIWVDGPEAGQQFWQGDSGGTGVGSLYSNWDADPSQPDGGTDNALHMFSIGTWNDIIDGSSQAHNYFIEYSGPGLVTGSIAGNATDVDGGTLTFSQTSSIAGLIIAGDGSWTFDQTDAAYDSIGAGEASDFIETYEVSDGTLTASNTLTLTVNGVNNAAIITGTTTGSVTEDTISAAGADLFYEDVDANNADDLWEAQTGVNGTYGEFGITTAGVWTYTLDDSDPVDALNDGDIRTDSFTVATKDQTTTTVTVTINGATDVVPLTANDDAGFIETVDVLILAPASAPTTATLAQLNGANGNFFDFNATFQDSGDVMADIDWDGMFLGYDVVLAGTNGFGDINAVDGQVAWERLALYHQNGGAVVTTGSIVVDLETSLELALELALPTAATLAALDAITPLAPQTGTSSAAGVTINTGVIHPVTDNVADFSDVTVPWYFSQQLDAGTTVDLAYPAGGSVGQDAIVVKEAVDGVTGNAVWLGGTYLDSTLPSTGLRSGARDQLLEQALGWAAGVNKVDVNENIPFTFTAASLLANDLSAETATITGASAYSAHGATIRLIGGNLAYDPTTSFDLNALLDGATLPDSFDYTISDGAQVSTATVTVTVNGIDDVSDAPPTLTGTEFNGFGLSDGTSNTYTYGSSPFSDLAEGPGHLGGGVQYLVYRSGVPGDPPTGVTFTSGNTFIFAAGPDGVDYLEDMTFYAYEGDGQNSSFDVGYSVKPDGNLRFLFSDVSEMGRGPVLEIAFDDDAGFTGEDTLNGGQLVDLSGIDSLAPGVLERADMIDMRNGQENSILIDTDELLALIGGPLGVGSRQVTIEADSYDNFLSEGQGFTLDGGWRAVSGTVNDTIDYHIPNEGGGLGDIFLTLTIDGTDGNINSPA